MGQRICGGLPTVRTFINDFVKTQLDNFLHKNPDTAEAIQRKILQAERERKELSGIRKIAKERAKKQANKKIVIVVYILVMQKTTVTLKLHYLLQRGFPQEHHKIRDVNTQAVFSLKGKPLNCYGLQKNCVRK